MRECEVQEQLGISQCCAWNFVVIVMRDARGCIAHPGVPCEVYQAARLVHGSGQKSPSAQKHLLPCAIQKSNGWYSLHLHDPPSACRALSHVLRCAECTCETVLVPYSVKFTHFLWRALRTMATMAECLIRKVVRKFRQTCKSAYMAGFTRS